MGPVADNFDPTWSNWLTFLDREQQAATFALVDVALIQMTEPNCRVGSRLLSKSHQSKDSRCREARV